MKNFVKVIEYDLAPSLIINFFMIGLGEFFVFAAVFSYFLLIAGAIMVVAYQKKSYKLLFILRIFIVVLTFCAFLNIFVDNMTYKDAYPDLLGAYASNNNNNQNSTDNSGTNVDDN